MRTRFPISRMVALAAALALVAAGAADTVGAEQNKKPSISIRANPPIGFSPLRVVLTAELKGGANDYQEFYCPTAEWEWGDDTRSESTLDCDPYEAGKSEIKRRYIMEHTFRAESADVSGAPTGPTQFRVRFVLKQKTKVVGSAQTIIELRAGSNE